MRRIVAAACVLAALAACKGTYPPPLTQLALDDIQNAGAAQASIPLHHNTGDKTGLNLHIRVGGAKARAYLLDTGSDGFWVYPNAIGKNYSPTSYTLTNSYGSGLEYTGTVVTTTLDFGQGLKTNSVPIVLVTSATCESNKPNCGAIPNATVCPGVKPGPMAWQTCLEQSRKLYGTFGAGLEPKVVSDSSPGIEIYNALFAIAQPWANAFVITPSRLQLGPRSSVGYTWLQLAAGPAVPAPLPNGVKSWKRDAKACFTIGTTLKNKCVATLFDTGATDINIQFNANVPWTTTSCGQLATKGTAFALRTPSGATLASFPAGYRENWNAIYDQSNSGKKQVNTGLTFFNRDAIYYDGVNGRVGLAPLKEPGHLVQKTCSV